MSQPGLKHRRSTLIGVILVVLLAAGGSLYWSYTAKKLPGFTGSGSSSTKPTYSSGPLVIDATKTSWQLPTALERTVVLNNNGQLLILGGLDSRGNSTTEVLSADPINGKPKPLAPLPQATHDAAGAMLGNNPVIFGGGATNSFDSVQQPGAGIIGKLPSRRSDLGAVTIGKTTYLAGGYDGSNPTNDILATTNGRRFDVVAKLSQGVRYPAVAALGDTLYLIGGETMSGGSTKDIVAVNVTTGAVASIHKLPQPLSHASAFVLNGQLFVAGGTDGNSRTNKIWRFDPANGTASPAGLLPYAVADAGVTVIGNNAYMVGGTGNSKTPLDSVLQLATKPAPTVISYDKFGPGHLAPGSDPSVLPGPFLVADRDNNRLVEISPTGQVIWEFPRPGDLAPGQVFKVPDDAFFTPDGKQIIATQEDNFVVSLIDIASNKMVWSYGKPGVSGSGPNLLWNPDDAIVVPSGEVVIPDIMNCRIIVVAPGGHSSTRSYGRPGACRHNPPQTFGSPNGAFPTKNGNWLVTEINGSWVSELAPGGKVLWSTHPQGVTYPSDTTEIGSNRYLTVDYSPKGQILIFDKSGSAIWRFRPTSGPGTLDHPSLALGLPNGDVIVNDDANHRIVVIDPRTDQIVWQYGVKGKLGNTPGLLNNPDGMDFLPPYSLIETAPKNLQAL